MSAPIDEHLIARQARWSWLCPVIAWTSQIVLAIALRSVHGFAMGFFWTAVAVVQVILIGQGINLGVKVLRLGQSAVSSGNRRAALFGIVLSGGTVLLIGIMIVSTL